MTRSRLLLPILLSAGLSAGAAAQQADVLTGLVVGEDGRPIAGARVEVMSVESEITRSVLTSSSGRYMLIFPDGGGRYLMRATYLGMADVVQVVMREADEELLLANLTMAPQAIQLQGLAVTAQRAPSQAGAVGEQSTTLRADLVGRLPLSDLDPTTLALLAGGVVATSLDSITGMMGFSVAGMSDLLNQITLDGMVVAEGMGVPELGVRATQVTTSTFDVSRGGFAGGEVAMATTRGNNRASGALTYRLDNDALQIAGTPTTNVSLGRNWSEALPFVEMPQGRVRITSDFEDGTRGTRTVVFGGNRSMPTESYSRDVQLSNACARPRRPRTPRA